MAVNQPTGRMPPTAARIIQPFHGSGCPTTAMVPAVRHAARSALRRMAGATRAMKVSGMAKPSDQDSGIVAPKTTPITVVTCQQIHKVIPVPRRW